MISVIVYFRLHLDTGNRKVYLFSFFGNDHRDFEGKEHDTNPGDNAG